MLIGLPQDLKDLTVFPITRCVLFSFKPKFMADGLFFTKHSAPVGYHGGKLSSFNNLLKIVFGQIGSCPTVKAIENCRHIKRMSTT